MKKFVFGFVLLLIGMFPTKLARADTSAVGMKVRIINETGVTWQTFAQVFQGNYYNFQLNPHQITSYVFTTPDHATILSVSFTHQNPTYFFRCLKGFDPATTHAAVVTMFKVPNDSDPYQCSMYFAAPDAATAEW